jgi:hypothetical protein
MDLRFRQIHLDFHTSESIGGVGSQFDPEEFVTTLEKARVNSITCFARCHHGWIYYDTKLNPERRHPHLAVNLLKAQIDVCHARNIRVPIYTNGITILPTSIRNGSQWMKRAASAPSKVRRRLKLASTVICA